MQALKKLVQSGKKSTCSGCQTYCGMQFLSLTSWFKQQYEVQCWKCHLNITKYGYNTTHGHFCEIVSIQTEGYRTSTNAKLLCQAYKKVKPVFIKPCDSPLLEFEKVYENETSMKYLRRAALAKKCFVTEQGPWRFFKPLLHEQGVFTFIISTVPCSSPSDHLAHFSQLWLSSFA